MSRLGPLQVIVIAFLLVIVINGLLILATRRRGRSWGISVFRQAMRIARNPWEEEDQALAELRRRVSALSGEAEDDDDGSPDAN